MRVNYVTRILCCNAQSHQYCRLVDDVGRMRAHHMHSQDTARGLVGEHFAPTVHLAGGHGLAVGAVIGLAGNYLGAGALLFGLADVW